MTMDLAELPMLAPAEGGTRPERCVVRRATLASFGVEELGDDRLTPPPAALAEYVLYFWRRRFPAGRRSVLQPTLPDGCVDLLAVNGGPSYLMGPETVRADHVVHGGTEIVGVRLRPGVGARLFGGLAAKLVDSGGFLHELGPARRVRSAAAAALAEVPGEHRRLMALLLPRMANAAPDDGVAAGIAWLARHPDATVDQLSRRLGWSPREIRRRFTAALGFGPKLMQRMLRFQRVLHEARVARRETTLSRVAAVAGYADQAHMTREFRALAFTTPAALLGGSFDSTIDPLLTGGRGSAGRRVR
jgi:AraC-like DNA-binding protein